MPLDMSYLIHDYEKLKTSIIVDGDYKFAFGIHPDVNEHIKMTRYEFVGKPEFCFHLAKIIIFIRRNINLDNNLRIYFDIVNREMQFFCKHLTTRWLLSVCVTYSDHGSPVQRGIAQMLVCMFNMMKLSETERRLAADAQYAPEKIQSIREAHGRREHIELWDGVTAYSVQGGDMPRNMFCRMLSICDLEPPLSLVFHTLLERALVADTMFSRYVAHNPGFLPPIWRERKV
jgi:hypothetical protein